MSKQDSSHDRKDSVTLVWNDSTEDNVILDWNDSKEDSTILDWNDSKEDSVIFDWNTYTRNVVYLDWNAFREDDIHFTVTSKDVLNNSTAPSKGLLPLEYYIANPYGWVPPEFVKIVIS